MYQIIYVDILFFNCIFIIIFDEIIKYFVYTAV